MMAVISRKIGSGIDLRGRGKVVRHTRAAVHCLPRAGPAEDQPHPGLKRQTKEGSRHRRAAPPRVRVEVLPGGSLAVSICRLRAASRKIPEKRGQDPGRGSHAAVGPGLPMPGGAVGRSGRHAFRLGFQVVCWSADRRGDGGLRLAAGGGSRNR